MLKDFKKRINLLNKLKRQFKLIFNYSLHAICLPVLIVSLIGVLFANCQSKPITDKIRFTNQPELTALSTEYYVKSNRGFLLGVTVDIDGDELADGIDLAGNAYPELLFVRESIKSTIKNGEKTVVQSITKARFIGIKDLFFYPEVDENLLILFSEKPSNSESSAKEPSKSQTEQIILNVDADFRGINGVSKSAEPNIILTNDSGYEPVSITQMGNKVEVSPECLNGEFAYQSIPEDRYRKVEFLLSPTNLNDTSFELIMFHSLYDDYSSINPAHYDKEWGTATFKILNSDTAGNNNLASVEIQSVATAEFPTLSDSLQRDEYLSWEEYDTSQYDSYGGPDINFSNSNIGRYYKAGNYTCNSDSFFFGPVIPAAVSDIRTPNSEYFTHEYISLTELDYKNNRSFLQSLDTFNDTSINTIHEIENFDRVIVAKILKKHTIFLLPENKLGIKVNHNLDIFVKLRINDLSKYGYEVLDHALFNKPRYNQTSELYPTEFSLYSQDGNNLKYIAKCPDASFSNCDTQVDFSKDLTFAPNVGLFLTRDSFTRVE